MRFYARVIPEALFRELRRAGRVFSEEGFVLGGGTAVALRFGHRRSEDPEFFREEPMPYPEVVAERLRREAGLFVRAIARGTIHGSLAGSPVRSAGPISRTSARPERDASRLDVPGKARMLGLPIKALRLMWRCRRDPPAHRVRRRIGESHRSDRGAAPPAGSGKSESKGG
jgi:hypothetical protein